MTRSTTVAIADLAARCNTSEPTVMRFLPKLGLDSYRVFRVEIAQEIPQGACTGRTSRSVVATALEQGKVFEQAARPARRN